LKGRGRGQDAGTKRKPGSAAAQVRREGGEGGMIVKWFSLDAEKSETVLL